MKFPPLFLLTSAVALANLSIGPNLFAQEASPSGDTILRLPLQMDGQDLRGSASAIILLPGMDSRRLSIEFPLTMPPSGPAVREDQPGGVSFAMPLDASVRWHLSDGIGAPKGLTVIDWVPPDGGKPAQVTATLEVRRVDASGVQQQPWRAEASARFLPGVHFDRDGSGVIGDFVVGVYPNEFAADAPAIVRRKPETYRPPSLFYRLDESTRDLELSSRLTLGGLCPPVIDSETSARFVAINPKLVGFWDALSQEVEAAGKQPGALRILRGFVSPNERQRLERLGVQLASFTRYQYGDALAVIYDEGGDFRMDDLDGDGQITVSDGDILAGWTRTAMANAGVSGGLGLESAFEGPNHIGTPYVHMDLRGGGVVEWRN
jgi:hypothetical protein